MWIFRVDYRQLLGFYTAADWLAAVQTPKLRHRPAGALTCCTSRDMYLRLPAAIWPLRFLLLLAAAAAARPIQRLRTIWPIPPALLRQANHGREVVFLRAGSPFIAFPAATK